MQILMITASTTPDADHTAVVDRARALNQLGHEMTVLHLRTARRLTGAHAKAERSRNDGIDVLRVEVPRLPGPLRGGLAGILRRALPRALRAQGITRPDLLITEMQLMAMSAAQVLSVSSGVPHLVVAQDDHALQALDRRDRETIGHVLQEALTVVAQPGVAEHLRRLWFLPALETLPEGGRDTQAEALSGIAVRALRSSAGPPMVFHAPYALDPSPGSASRQRPNMMFEAFKRTGHRVHLITGDPGQRRRDAADLRRRRRAGQRIAFVYSENSTQPNLLSTSAFHGLAPLLEARLIAWCACHRIPFGQFYRDVYWRFPEKQASVAPLRRSVMQVAYRFDLAVLRWLRAHFFLPSLRMAPLIPAPLARCSELPPGAQIPPAGPQARQRPEDGLRLLYVGGVGPGHEIDECLAALRELPQVHLTMVVPRAAWEAHQDRYLPLLTDRVRVVHAGAGELAAFYDEACACLLFVEPNEYREFAVPMKLYEYLGHGKPTLASRDTLAGTIVEELGIGFTATNERMQIAGLLRHLLEHPGELENCAERVRAVRHEQSWDERARTAAAELRGGRRT